MSPLDLLVRSRVTASNARRLRALSAAEWRDFKARWPYHLWEVLYDFGAGTALGVVFGLSVLLYVLDLAQ